MSTLVVAEKPSVARDIARVLGANAKGNGCLSGSGYVVTWALGHLVTPCDPHEVNPAWKRWSRESLPMLPEKLPTKVIEKTKAQYAIVSRLMNSAETEQIVCATDAGREGELIFRYIYYQCRCKKPFSRLWISSMTDTAIREGFENLRPGHEYDALYASAKCRSVADWLVGMNASRAFTLRYDTLLSLGRVQTPTLALIVKRDRAIEEFVPAPYFELRADFGDYKALWVHPKTKETRSDSREEVEEIAKRVQGKSAVVSSATREKKRTPPPRLYDLTTLQREANSRFGFSAKKTLDIAQALYERHKLITYPRTDSPCLPNDMAAKLPKVLSAIASDTSLAGELASFAGALLPTPPRPKRVYDDGKISDHHAIIPTGVSAGSKKLTADEGKVFDMIARRLVAALMADYEYLAMKIETRCEGELFRCSGQSPVSPGWRALYPNERKKSGAGSGSSEETESDAALPDVKKGDARTLCGSEILSKMTKAPARLTTASLLEQMEHAGREISDEALRETMKDSGLGTPATRAAIIERLKTVGYIVEKGKVLTSTEKGRMLISVVPEEIASAETTGRWEKALNKMARAGSAEAAAPLYAKFIASIHRYCAYLVQCSDAK